MDDNMKTNGVVRKPMMQVLAACLFVAGVGTAVAAETAAYTSKSQLVQKAAPAQEAEAQEEAQKPAEADATKAEQTAADPTSLDIKGDKDTWISVSATGAAVSGSQSTFRQRAQVPQGFSGGIDEFHTEGEVGKDTMLEIDGRGIWNNYDYLLKFNLAQPELGYVDAGYKQFRTWYDNTGGWFPKNGQWYDLYNNQVFAIDRATIWFEAGLTLPDVPEITFRYERDTRDGRKDSTIWGDSAKTGSTANAALGSRAFVPTFWDMHEANDSFGLDVKHKLEDTRFGGGVRYELYTQDDGRFITRRPYETGLDRRVTQKEVIDSDMFNVRGWQQTDLDEDSSFTSAYSFTTMDTDLGGSRIYGAGFDAPYIPRFPHRQTNDEGFFAMSGGATVNQHVATLNYVTIPWEDTKLILALRIEDEAVDAISSYEESNIGAAPGRVPSLTSLHTIGNEESLNIAESIELRYDGIKDWLLYLRMLWEQTDGAFYGRLIESDTGLNDVAWNQDIGRYSQKYEIGANWYPAKEVTVAGQYYFRNRSTDYAFPVDSTVNGPSVADRYPDYLVYQEDDTHDANLRVTWRPCTSLTLVSRGDLQRVLMYAKGGTLSVIESADIQNYILSETITWNATSRLYLQGNATWTWSRTNTPANERTSTARDLVLDSYSCYWYASAMAGFALTQEADLQAQYSYYRSYPFLDNSGQSMPYGLDDEEQTVSIGVLWRVCENVRWNLKYGFMKNQDGVYGQHNNYTAHLVSSGIDMAF